ncbi:unnamed protein product [Linum trigynum]|uniref:Uncharacterized protein n=1 Tax=Linum trigynum TaxID=586398 RepID=A0AAV2DBH6_9ROSI
MVIVDCRDRDNGGDDQQTASGLMTLMILTDEGSGILVVMIDHGNKPTATVVVNSCDGVVACWPLLYGGWTKK